MHSIVGKKIITVKMEDSRFVQGEGIEEFFRNNDWYGKILTVYFDDHTYFVITPIMSQHNEMLVGGSVGKWRENDNHEIEHVYDA